MNKNHTLLLFYFIVNKNSNNGKLKHISRILINCIVLKFSITIHHNKINGLHFKIPL